MLKQAAEGVGFSAIKRNLLKIRRGACWDARLVMRLGVPFCKANYAILAGRKIGGGIAKSFCTLSFSLETLKQILMHGPLQIG